MMYDKWHKNNNHFTTEYHRKFSLPLLFELLDIHFDEKDFFLKEKKFNEFDLSVFHPIANYKYEIFGFNRNEHFDNLSYDDLVSNDSNKTDITPYHKLYKYSHENSRIINKTINSEKKLFISGDSQMIPDIAVLSCFFKEIWYLDNRDGLKLSNYWKDIDFSSVLIELNEASLEQYICKNFN